MNFKPIPNFPNYYINSKGEVKKIILLKSGDIKEFLVKEYNGNVCLRNEGKYYCRSINKFIKEIFEISKKELYNNIKSENLSQKEIAKKYNISQSKVSRIKRYNIYN